MNAIVAPSWVLSGDANNGVDDFLMEAWPTRLALITGVELLRDEFPMPSQNRVGCEDRCELQQRLAANGLSFHGELSTLIVTQEQSLPAELRHQNLNLSVLEFDDLLLTFTHKAAEKGQQKLPRLE